MNKQAINFSWPAVLSNFSQDSGQENFSRAKLKVFYKGETADHRYFSNDFAEQLIQSLPYTPVVSSYDEEKEDFVGHATEQQILGIVDPCTEPVFEKSEKDDQEWCVCDVVLYTSRPDTVGKLAKKVEGHPQSLELDPSSVKYKINYDEKKHFKNIEFTAGRFVGVSVLGQDQKPAFTGSAFFSCDKNFEEKMNILKEYCESKKDQSQHGGKNMDLKEFMKLSWGDISTKVNDAVSKEYGNDAYTCLVDMYEDSAIVRFFYYVEEVMKLMRVKYTCNENGDILLGNINEVRMVYEDIVEKEESSNPAFTDDNASNVETDMEQQQESTEKEEAEEVVTDSEDAGNDDNNTHHDDQFHDDEENNDANAELLQASTDETAEVVEETAEEVKVDEVVKPTEEVNLEEKENVEITEDNASITADENQVKDNEENNDDDNHYNQESQLSVQEEDSSASSLTDSEREEFETLKRDKKVGMVDSYKEFLTEEEYSSFIAKAKLPETSERDLEFDLLKKYKEKALNRQIEEDDNKKQPSFRAFAVNALDNKNRTESALDAFVRKNIR